jgi:hypothetical protein
MIKKIIKKNKKGALEFSFSWIFAVVAGAFILFLAIFAVIKITKIIQDKETTTTAVSIGNLLNPLESGFESATKSLIKTQIETRIYSGCISSGYFGKQTIQTSEKINNKWSETGLNVAFQNKYIFSGEYVEGKNFYVYSKPFDFPFKVADLLYLTSNSSDYCFIRAPERIEKEMENDLKAPNLLFEELSRDCPEDSIIICFNTGTGCDVIVEENAKSVKKNGETSYYEGDALMYAAIFSSKEIYECQLTRLMKRAGQLSLIYKDKSAFLTQRVGCNSEITADLTVLSQREINFGDSSQLINLVDSVESIQTKNENEGECKLW